jgi:pimeloyl-ACP methyl ester carboxylesterase
MGHAVVYRRSFLQPDALSLLCRALTTVGACGKPARTRAGSTDFSGELGTAPTLMVRGERDAFFPRRGQEALAAAIAKNRPVLNVFGMYDML